MPEPCCGKLKQVAREKDETTGTSWTTYRCEKCRRLQTDADVRIYGYGWPLPFGIDEDDGA